MLRSSICCALVWLVSNLAQGQVPDGKPVRLAEPKPVPSPTLPLAIPPLPLPRASELTSSEHLRQAIDHLQRAGLKEDAEQLQRKLDDQQEQRFQDWQAKRKQLEQLKCEITELESRLAGNQRYEFECSIAILQPSALSKAQRLFPAEALSIPGLPILSNGEEIRAGISAMEGPGTFKLLSRPNVIATAGEHASITVSYPVNEQHDLGRRVSPASGTDSAPTSESRHSNLLILNLKAIPQRHDCVFLHAGLSNSGRGYQLESTSMPDFNVKLESSIPLGRSLVTMGPKFSHDGQEWVPLVIITPRLAEPSPESHREARLEPIPDENLIR